MAADVPGAGGAEDGLGAGAAGEGLAIAGLDGRMAGTDVEPRAEPSFEPSFEGAGGRMAGTDAEPRADSDEGRGGGTGGGAGLPLPVAPMEGSDGRGGGRGARGGAAGTEDARPPIAGAPEPPPTGAGPGFTVGDSLSEGGIRNARGGAAQADLKSTGTLAGVFRGEKTSAASMPRWTRVRCNRAGGATFPRAGAGAFC